MGLDPADGIDAALPSSQEAGGAGPGSGRGPAGPEGQTGRKGDSQRRVKPVSGPPVQPAGGPASSRAARDSVRTHFAPPGLSAAGQLANAIVGIMR